MKKVSIILPSIRPQNLYKWWLSASLACQKYKWEVVIVSPYNLPEELGNTNNIKFIKSNRNALICKQMGALLCNAEFIFNTTDDAMLMPHSIDSMIKLWEKKDLGKFDVINGRYREGALDANTLEPVNNIPPELNSDYWKAGTHQSLKLAGINPEWRTSLHFFMRLEDFYNLGGLNCNSLYEYSVYPILELMFLCQQLGGKIIDSETEVSWCSHLPCLDGDHGPVHWAMMNDEEIFKTRFSNKDIATVILKSYSNQYCDWKKHDKRWERRFK